MHEYSITRSIIDILEGVGRKNDLKSIKKVNFVLGPSASVEPESIRFYYRYLTEDNTLLKDSELIFKRSELVMSCLKCKNLFKKDKIELVCPECGSSKVKIQETEDIKIVSVET